MLADLYRDIDAKSYADAAKQIMALSELVEERRNDHSKGGSQSITDEAF